ncbi:maleylpyruvate isomerase N-terminal domain-containing protein [Streptomyces sp. NBC_00704]|uniref:maleylpyruvate isomerase family mycothiol-dependent enzyme n=1 Tax=Streptomyces sp. NBC_00704 TaxID=2975809 RepID=UPI002E380E49|nr:maleylpyruvate isomerase family mycothiol-dependent enzyme [Streptomyces sp. NBC_00704]
MQDTWEFTDLLRLIDDRSHAFRAAISAAPSLDVRVPTCPEWTLYDLVKHLGEGRRVWAATVAAGPDATGKAVPQGDWTAPREREDLPAWLAASTQLLLDALREAGPDRRCWTFWGRSQSPLTATGVARRQLHEIAVHTYDAQLTVGAAQPVPEEVALDGVEEFLSTFGTTDVAWPHEPAVVDYHATEGRSWRSRLSDDGSRLARLPAPGAQPAPDGTPAVAADASMAGTASELVLALHGRIPQDSLKLDGDLRLFEQLMEWDPER